MDINIPSIINTTNKSSLKLYELSLQSSSNASSSILLNDVWSTSSKLFNGETVNHIFDSATNILQKAETSHKKIWKTALSKIDPVSLLENSLPTCTYCTDQEYIGLEQFQKNECRYGQNLVGTKISTDTASEHGRVLDTLVERTVGPYILHEVETPSNDRQPLKHKFGRSRTMNEKFSSLAPNKNISEIDWSKEEEAEKAHKSNVAKITFKTAREQLLASNPAARRVLGTSRKAQAKFVSPMMGANTDKQENMEPEISDERLKHIDAKMIELIESEIIDKGTPIGWDDIAGLQLAKSVIQEAVVWPLLRPDIFTGLRRPPKGILLFGPPGTGKTLIGKCVAVQCNATFFSISASSLTSKWTGDGEKMVRALFAVARCHQPAVIFIDEIDSLLTKRSDDEHESTRRIKTEFLVQFDGAATVEEDRLLIVGATNRPQELDEAARRRLVKRLYIPLPDEQARCQIVSNLLQNETNSLTPGDMREVARLTEGYSGADMKSLCSEAAMGPIRAVPLSQIATIDSSKVRPVCLQDFTNALQRVRPSVSQDDLGQYVKWNNTYGQGF